jgi:pimeloyl-ACP methyl ester carboxylesterase
MPPVPDIRYARNDDVHIAFTAFGAGPDLVVAPGFISHQEVAWEEPSVVHFFERLASFRRVITFDKRGVGLSDPTGSPPTVEECADDLGAVMDAAGSERADVLGVSEGGAMATLFAAMHPERVRSLVVFGSFPRLLEADDYRCGVTADDLAALLTISDRGWGEGAGLGAWAPSRRDDVRLREWWARLQRMAATPGMVRAIFGLYPSIDVRQSLPLIQAPTLVLHRQGDRMVPIDLGRYLAEHIPGARFVELEGTDHLFFTGDADTLLDEIEEFLTGVRHTAEPDRVLATVLFTDVVGSTERAVQIGDARWRELLDAHHAQVRRQLERFRGREVKTTGDGFVAVFDGPARAIRCAAAIRDAVRGLGLTVRAGLHTGEVEVVGDDIAGVAVHLAARVSSCAEAGEVWVSRTVVDLVAGSGLTFADRGEHELKGVPGSWQLFAVET